MKKALLCLTLLSGTLSAAMEDPDAEDHMILSEQSNKMFKKENKTAQQAIQNDVTKQEYSQLKEKQASAQMTQQQKQLMQQREQQQGAAAASMHERASSDVMIVDPNVMAKDWANAFEALNAKRLMNITFVLRDHSTITNVSNLEAMPGGYLMLFTLKTVQGTKYRIVKTGDISSLETR